MYVKLIYPEMTASEYVDTIDELNEDISMKSNLLFLPRVIWLGISAFLYLLLIPAVLFLWRFIFYIITAKPVMVIVTGLIIAILAVPGGIYLIKVLLEYIRVNYSDRLMFLSKMETFTYSPYTERDDSRKYVNGNLNYYHMCDILKKSAVKDVALDLPDDDAKECHVTISYSLTGSEKIKLIKLNMPYRQNPGVTSPIVNLERMNVIFPLQEHN